MAQFGLPRRSPALLPEVSRATLTRELGSSARLSGAYAVLVNRSRYARCLHFAPQYFDLADGSSLPHWLHTGAVGLYLASMLCAYRTASRRLGASTPMWVSCSLAYRSASDAN